MNHPGQPAKKSGRGCWIALAIIGTLMLLCGGGVTIVGWMVWQNEDVQRGFRAFGAGFELIAEALSAPGTAELRAAGCQTAMVMTPEMFERLVRAIEPDASVEDELTMPLVTCQLAPQATLSCEAAAQIYAGAVSPPPAEFMVQVQYPATETQPHCQGVYAPDGRRLRDLVASETQGLGTVGDAVDSTEAQ